MQVAELQKHNEDLIQEMSKVMTELEKAKPGKAKKKPSDADDPSKVCSAITPAVYIRCMESSLSSEVSHSSGLAPQTV